MSAESWVVSQSQTQLGLLGNPCLFLMPGPGSCPLHICMAANLVALQRKENENVPSAGLVQLDSWGWGFKETVLA